MSDIRGGNGTVGGYYVAQTYVAGSPSVAQELYESFQDAISLVDVKSFTTIRTFIGTIVGSDGLANKTIKALVDSISLSDSWSRVIDLIRSFSDTIGLSGILARFTSKATLTDDVTLTENYSVVQVFIKFLSDSITLADSAIKNVHKVLTGDITVADVISKIHPPKIFTDTIALADNIVKKAISKGVDTILMAESLLKSLLRALSENIVITDSFSSFRLLVKNFIENLSISDNVTKSVTILLRSVVSLADHIWRRVNGLLVLWDKFVKGIGEWTSRDKKIDSYSSMSKTIDDWTHREEATGTYTQVSTPDDEWNKLKDEQHNE